MATSISAIETHYLQFRIQWSSIALLYYDYALTLPSEIRYMWGPRFFKISTLLYICCRYALVANVIYFLAIADKLGNKVVSSQIFFATDTHSTCMGIVFIMRTYAVCGRSRIILYGLTLLGLACVILDCMHVPGESCRHYRPIAIGEQGHMSVGPYRDGSLSRRKHSSIRICLAVRMSVVRLAYNSEHPSSSSSRSEQKQETNLPFPGLGAGTHILCDSVSFLFTTATGVLNLVANGGFLQRLLNAYLVPLSGLLTARFLLYIRVWDGQQSVMSTSEDAPELGTVSALQVVSRVFSLVADEFGDDPMAREAAQMEATTPNSADAEDPVPLEGISDSIMMQDLSQGSVTSPPEHHGLMKEDA
ncbi:hypothetical protein EW146_g6739 [Bondarzewia mesenterica]|uniref:DUF6533 domain-containing protein n=1 Tax=Bondarzewia mesenterica TaxID=1095465 RepID=A0A4S4LTC2_9AGAM|nr:hypothetical protein EW146_g6739 [Bondarzewia mesenterica]